MFLDEAPRARPRMTAEQLAAALSQLGYGPEEFARITGTTPANIWRALNGEAVIPRWVPIVTGLLTLRGGPEMAEAIAAIYHEEYQD